MLLQESRRTARTTPGGDLVLLEDQDRSLWNREQIAEGKALVERALASRRVGRVHDPSRHRRGPCRCRQRRRPPTGRKSRLGTTCWFKRSRSPVVELNRAVAVAMRDGPAAGLDLIDAILARGDLADYHLAYAARAEMCRRLGQIEQSRAAYERALALAKQEPERRFLANRLREIS